MERRKRHRMPRHDPIPSRRILRLGALRWPGSRDAQAGPLQEPNRRRRMLDHCVWVCRDDVLDLLYFRGLSSSVPVSKIQVSFEV